MIWSAVQAIFDDLGLVCHRQPGRAPLVIDDDAPLSSEVEWVRAALGRVAEISGLRHLETSTTSEQDSMCRPPFHPDAMLADERDKIGGSPAEVARRLNVEPSRISRILNGEQGIIGDTALRLAEQQAGAEINALPTRAIAPTPLAQPALL